MKKWILLLALFIPIVALAQFDTDLPGGGGSSDVVDDTTPQLGGDLDVNGNDIADDSDGAVTIKAGDTLTLTSGQFVLGGVTYYTGTGSPESVVSAAIGSFYTADDGGSGTTGYLKESGAGTNTGWVAISSAATAPGGADTYVQYNNAGAFGGHAGFRFTGTQAQTFRASGVNLLPYATNTGSLIVGGADSSGTGGYLFTTGSAGASVNDLIVIGSNINSSQSKVGCVQFGGRTDCKGNYGIAIGYEADIEGAYADAISIGNAASVNAANCVLAGAGTSCGTGAVDCVAIGTNSNCAANAFNAVAIGENAIASDNWGVSIGLNSNCGAGSLGAVAIGQTADSDGQYAIAIGSSTQSDGVQSIAMGYQANCQHENAACIGEEATSYAADQFVVGGLTNPNYFVMGETNPTLNSTTLPTGTHAIHIDTSHDLIFTTETGATSEYVAGKPVGSMFMSSSNATTIASSTWVDVAGVWAGRNLNKFTVSGNNLTAGASSGGTYSVIVSASAMAAMDAANETFNVGISVNGADPTADCFFPRKMGGASDVGSITIGCLVDLADLQTLELQANSDSDAGDLTFSHVNMMALYQGS